MKKQVLHEYAVEYKYTYLMGHRIKLHNSVYLLHDVTENRPTTAAQ